MSQNTPTLLDTLTALGKADAALARIGLERKKLDLEAQKHAETVKKADAQQAAIAKALEERRTAITKGEKMVRDETAKLDDRRKALSSFGDYKLQQAAEREIDHAARQLSTHEDAILKLMEEAQALEAQLAAAQALSEKVRAAAGVFVGEMKAALLNYAEREKEYLGERESQAKLVDADNLKLYQRARDKYPTDPLAAVKDNTCVACYMQIQPQAILLLGKSQQIVRCPGCARILHLAAN